MTLINVRTTSNNQSFDYFLKVFYVPVSTLLPENQLEKISLFKKIKNMFHHHHHQAVTVTFDPPLDIDGCHCWQLLRDHHTKDCQQHHHQEQQDSKNNNIKLYSATDSERLAHEDGFILVAMNPDGSLFRKDKQANDNENATQNYYFAAPSKTIPDLLSKPITKGAITLAQYCSYSSSSHKNNAFKFQVERYPGGGIAFKTTLGKVAQWMNSEKNNNNNDASTITTTVGSENKNDNTIPHFLTDEGRLLTAKVTQGQPAGFIMNLAYPPVVDVTCLLDHYQNNKIEKQNKNKNMTIASSLVDEINLTKKFLVDAAVDCGFFFASIRYDAKQQGKQEEAENSVGFRSSIKSNTFLSAQEAHEANLRLMEMIRMLFGRSVSTKKRQQQLENVSVSSSNIVPLDAQMTKVTLKSTTGQVKTSFNPPVSVNIELPQWMRGTSSSVSDNLQDCCSDEYFRYGFVPSHFFEDDSKKDNSKKTLDSATTRMNDISTHFHFGEELAARMVGILLQAALYHHQSNETSTLPRIYPPPTEKQMNSKVLGDIEDTKISFVGDDEEDNNSERLHQLIPRIDPAQFYTLFRAVCYPPSTKRHDRKKQKLQQNTVNEKSVQTSSSKKTIIVSKKSQPIYDAEDDCYYEEVEEEEQEIDDTDEDEEAEQQSSHKSDDTDDSQGKGLYEHTDKTWITLLTACPSLHGLEVVDCDGSTFTECCVPKFCENAQKNGNNSDEKKIFSFICNIGDALQMASKGKFVSRTHRARNPNLSDDNNRGDTGSDENNNKKDEKDETKEEQDNRHEKFCCCRSCRISLPLFVEPSPYRWPVPYIVGEQ